MIYPASALTSAIPRSLFAAHSRFFCSANRIPEKYRDRFQPPPGGPSRPRFQWTMSKINIVYMSLLFLVPLAAVNFLRTYEKDSFFVDNGSEYVKSLSIVKRTLPGRDIKVVNGKTSISGSKAHVQFTLDDGAKIADFTMIYSLNGSSQKAVLMKCLMCLSGYMYELPVERRLERGAEPLKYIQDASKDSQ
eukprot:TRINITY_DN6929_c0_g1_i1.p1 TRINITY_DN6929_c0_g1~~TRINITY_DN6929_c0_g1_i1.p1  ORF type:complete len:191 (+),score=43.18 TRINITY_DN6929_c0_g1_i1:3-575(+)